MTLEEVRKQIDAIDPQIKELFFQRMNISYHVAEIKYAAGETTIFRADREADIIRRLTAGVDPAQVQEYTALIKKIMEVSRKYQYGLMYDWNPSFFTPLSEGLTMEESHTHVKVRMTCLDAPGSMAMILSMIGDYGFNVESLQLLGKSKDLIFVTFEVVILGNLLTVPMQKLMFQLSKETSDFHIEESF